MTATNDDHRRRSGMMRAVALLVGLLPGCSHESLPLPVTDTPQVTVERAQHKRLPRQIELRGTTPGLEQANVHALVRGVLKEQRIQPGDHVDAGDVLWLIDDEPFTIAAVEARAALSQAEANREKVQQSKAADVARTRLRLDQAQLEIAVADERRQSRQLAHGAGDPGRIRQGRNGDKKAAAQVDADQALLEQAEADQKTGLLAAAAAVETARAALQRAEFELRQCTIRAAHRWPHWRAATAVGGLVGADPNAPLATTEKLDPLGIDLRLPAPPAGRIGHRPARATSLQYDHRR